MSFYSPFSAQKNLKEAYNSFAKDFSSTRSYYWKEFERLSITTKVNDEILDIGCGNGRLFGYLYDKNLEIKYSGIDISKKLLKEAKNNNPNQDFSLGSFTNFSHINDKKYNKIWAVASFHHLSSFKERTLALKNIYSHLEKDGEFICTVWNLYNQKKYLDQQKNAKLRSIYNPLWNDHDFLIPWGEQKILRYYYSFDKNELENLLQENGFIIEDSFYSEKERNICIRAKKSKIYKFYIADIPFNILNIKNILSLIHKKSFIDSKNQFFITTPNPEMLVESFKNLEFKKILQNADLSLADGNGILWASSLSSFNHKFIFWKYIFSIYNLFKFFISNRSLEKKLDNPLCGSDIFKKYLDYSIKYINKKHIFLLGGKEGSSEYIKENYKSVISGIYSGKVNDNHSKLLISKINTSNAKVLFVALGSPFQELWINKNKKFLPNIKVLMGVGGSFDFISGKQIRAPLFIRNLSLEWLYRVFREPSRIKRIINATFVFIDKIIKTKI
jgi:N-acetylglucosaminyldiphosphoundecaprenol N-acetyl-beta-D-mannosaminyltransferase